MRMGFLGPSCLSLTFTKQLRCPRLDFSVFVFLGGSVFIDWWLAMGLWSIILLFLEEKKTLVLRQ
jgi:hypothetical protein